MADDDRKVTADLLRHRIDRGMAGDKKGFPDPAAAPLGTNDEAAGTPPTAEQIALAHAQEVEKRPDAPDVTHRGPVRPGRAEPSAWELGHGSAAPYGLAGSVAASTTAR